MAKKNKKYKKDEDNDNVHKWDDIEDGEDDDMPVIAAQDEKDYYALGN